MTINGSAANGATKSAAHAADDGADHGQDESARLHEVLPSHSGCGDEDVGGYSGDEAHAAETAVCSQVGDGSGPLGAVLAAKRLRIGEQGDACDTVHVAPRSPSLRSRAASTSAARRACSAAPTWWPSAVSR